MSELIHGMILTTGATVVFCLAICSIVAAISFTVNYLLREYEAAKLIVEYFYYRKDFKAWRNWLKDMEVKP